ncbi:MAG: sulfite oxidase, partial [Psychroserpens sp.]
MKSRRNFIKRTSVATLGVLIGSRIVFGKNLPKDYVPVIQQDANPYEMFGKHKDMVVLNNRPWNIEAVPHLLDDKVTPNEKMFIRNNGRIPEDVDASTWTLTIDGESVSASKTYTLQDLKTKFPQHTY